MPTFQHRAGVDPAPRRGRPDLDAVPDRSGPRGIVGVTSSPSTQCSAKRDAVAQVVAACTELGIDGDLETRAAYTYVEAADQVGTVEAEARSGAAAG